MHVLPLDTDASGPVPDEQASSGLLEGLPPQQVQTSMQESGGLALAASHCSLSEVYGMLPCSSLLHA